MIRGVVNARGEAILRIRIRGPGGVEQIIDAVVDSGFTASLALPSPTVAALGLIRISGVGGMLANGSIQHYDLFAAEIEWDGKWRPVVVSAIGRESLVGIGLLSGYELRIEVVPGGAVEITSLP
jgi:predicted aspartyl protease